MKVAGILALLVAITLGTYAGVDYLLVNPAPAKAFLELGNKSDALLDEYGNDSNNLARRKLEDSLDGSPRGQLLRHKEAQKTDGLLIIMGAFFVILGIVIISQEKAKLPPSTD